MFAVPIRVGKRTLPLAVLQVGDGLTRAERVRRLAVERYVRTFVNYVTGAGPLRSVSLQSEEARSGFVPNP